MVWQLHLFPLNQGGTHPYDGLLHIFCQSNARHQQGARLLGVKAIICCPEVVVEATSDILEGLILFHLLLHFDLLGCSHVHVIVLGFIVCHGVSIWWSIEQLRAAIGLLHVLGVVLFVQKIYVVRCFQKAWNCVGEVLGRNLHIVGDLPGVRAAQNLIKFDIEITVDNSSIELSA